MGSLRAPRGGVAFCDAATAALAASEDVTLASDQLSANPEVQPLLQSAPGWATTARDFTVEHCGP